MRDLKNISSELFDKIRTRFDNVRLGDEKSKATTDPEVARFFNFDYIIDGHKVGNITISLIDEQSLKLYYGRDIIEAIKEIDAETGGETADGVSNEQKWYNFLRSVRQFAKRNLLTFDTRDITKSNLEIKDPTAQLLSNKDGAVVNRGKDAINRIVDQIANPVRWDLCMESLVQLGVTGVIEFPPAGTLVGLLKRATPGIESFALKSPDDLAAAKEFAAKHGGA